MIAKNKFCISHLCISVIVGLFSAYIVFFVWYPFPLAQAIGVTQLFGLLLLIDIIVGPLLGWIVYKEGKKTLKFDLSVIIFVQILAYGYGIYSMIEGRPLWIVYSTYHFDIVQNKEIDEKDLTKAEFTYKQRSLFGPKFVALKGEEHYQDNNFAYQRRGWTSYPPNYTELLLVQKRMNDTAFDLKYLEQSNDPKIVEKIINKYSAADGWFPLKAPNLDMVVLIDKTKSEVIKIVNLRPLR